MTYETIVEERDNMRVKLVADEDPMSPRDADNLGVMWANHRGYTLGDENFAQHVPEFGELGDFIRSVQDHHGSLNSLTQAIVKHLQRQGSTVIKPLYLLDHSGLALSAGSNLIQGGEADPSRAFMSDPGGWDTSFVGFVFDTPRTRETCGTPLDRVEEVLQSEVEEYSSYLEGDVWGIVVEERVHVSTKITTRRPGVEDEVEESECESDDWQEIDSCWGYVGMDYAEKVAKEDLEAALRDRKAA